MLWHFEIRAKEGHRDPFAHEIEKELPWLGLEKAAPVRLSRLYLLGGDFDRATAQRLGSSLLADPVIQEFDLKSLAEAEGQADDVVTVCRKAGVTDPVEESIRRGAARLGIELVEVRTGLRFRFLGAVDREEITRIGTRLLANAVVDEILIGQTALPAHKSPAQQTCSRREIELPAEDGALLELSRSMGLALNLEEMQVIRAHFHELGRRPTDIELETLAQTWSEHCKHKTFNARIDCDGKVYDNLIKQTIFKATRDLDRDFCVSVFKDNAGIVRFDDEHNLCFKVETHNHPSAIEPYGGAGTGLGGVLRDILGTGLGAKPIANVDVFCVGDLAATAEDLPAGVIHPLRVLKGVVAGVRDYGNRMGIPTVSGAVFFDRRYTGNPLVYAGSIGLIPRDRCDKRVEAGDRIVALGGRTGRDGIHGATFSSMELHEDSETMDGGAVQIGNAITEKRCMDVLLAARDLGLYRCVTDCGAGGFSSAVGEMGEELGARVELGAAPLKYPGLSYTEVWISEAQERMVVAVPPEKLDEILALAASEDVETCVLGEFTGSGRLEIFWHGEQVADLDMEFLHDGLPRTTMKATWKSPPRDDLRDFAVPMAGEALRRLLADWNVASKEWIIRQYDHEVQSTSVIKPLVGIDHAGPSDGAVNAPVLGSRRAYAVGLGLCPHYADIDPYHMARAAIDEALRNVVAVGGDPDRCAILDNFSWGNTNKPDRLGALVRAAEGCHDGAMALRLPFISGKDSLNNEYATSAGTIVIPHTLLISALAIVEDLESCVSMDLKRSGTSLYLVGLTRRELGGGAYLRLYGRRGNELPQLGDDALAIHRRMHEAIRDGMVLSCHDCSEGGLGVAAAEMAFAGGIGLEVDLARVLVAGPRLRDDEILFSESLSRYLVEIDSRSAARFEALFEDLPCAAIGRTTTESAFRVRGRNGTVMLEEALTDLARIHSQSLTAVLEGDRRG
ncbi:MAG: phosphoribosylformylglycinamidine synthase subunit PurL [Planctomycetes bacterium]|nr:phosphoribosylformylglycinamidine synthase subunit PurL [Planctomycetota bacterium]